MEIFPPMYDAMDMLLMACILAPAIFCGGVCWERERVKKIRRARRQIRRSIR